MGKRTGNRRKRRTLEKEYHRGKLGQEKNIKMERERIKGEKGIEKEWEEKEKRKLKKRTG